MSEFRRTDWIPIILSILSSAVFIGITYGNATSRIDKVERQIATIEERGSVPVVRIEQKLDDLTREVREIKQDVRELRGKK